MTVSLLFSKNQKKNLEMEEILRKDKGKIKIN